MAGRKLVEVYTEEGTKWVRFNSDPRDPHPYEFEVERVPNFRAALIWLYHMGEKTWVSKEHLLEFLEEVVVKELKLDRADDPY